jgi:hypothetical protein
MSWTVLYHPDFQLEVDDFPTDVQDELSALIGLLQQAGPQLKRPHCDTLGGSKYANMKKLRFAAADGVWRVAFAFDPKRQAVLLVGGDKSGVGQKAFYKSLIRKADRRFDDWMN